MRVPMLTFTAASAEHAFLDESDFTLVVLGHVQEIVPQSL